MARMFSVTTIQKSFFEVVRTTVLEPEVALLLWLVPDAVPVAAISPATPMDDVVSRDMLT